MILRKFIDTRYAPWARAHLRGHKIQLWRLRSVFAGFAKYQLRDLRPGALDPWRSERLLDGASPGTVNRDVAVLKATLQKAVFWEILPENPLKSYRFLRYQPDAAGNALDDDELERLRAALDARGRDDRLRAIVNLAIYTGMRWGELATLRWSDWDRAAEQIRIRPSNAKSRKGRVLPLIPEATAALEDWRTAVGAAATAGALLVFPSKRGRRAASPRGAFVQTLAEAGVRKIRFHDLRHTFCTILSRRNVSMPQIKELAGHSTIQITMRYAQVSPRYMRDAVEHLRGLDGDWLGPGRANTDDEQQTTTSEVIKP